MAAAAMAVPAAYQQFNWVLDRYEWPEEQLELDLTDGPEEALPEGITLLATDAGTQLLVSGYGLYVGKKSERLVIKKGGATCAELPLLKLQEIIIGSKGVSLSSDLIAEACEWGIRIAFLSGGGKPFALLTSPMLPAAVETRKAQFRTLEGEGGAEIARWIVAGKLRNQEKLIRYFARNLSGAEQTAGLKAAASIKALRRQAIELAGESGPAVRAGLMGLEGTAGRLYWEQWKRLFPEDFAGRSHRGAADPVNSALNYGYGILLSHVWGALVNAGLEPFAGFLHTDRSGKPSLALDLMEEFRQPVVDRAVFGWLRKGGKIEVNGGMLTSAAREEVAARVMARMNSAEVHRGKSHQVRSIIQMQARLLASAVRGLREYRPFSFQW